MQPLRFRLTQLQAHEWPLPATALGAILMMAGAVSAQGVGWSDVGNGLSGSVAADVFAIAEFNGELVSGGNFVSGVGVARWDGVNWHPWITPINTSVQCLVVQGGDLIAAGGTAGNNVWRWNAAAQTWDLIGGGTNGAISALAVYNGDLIAGGSFTTAGGQAANRVARWNGTAWSAFSSGLNNQVLTMTEHEGDLIVGGAFSTAGGTPASRIARWSTAASSW